MRVVRVLCHRKAAAATTGTFALTDLTDNGEGEEEEDSDEIKLPETDTLETVLLQGQSTSLFLCWEWDPDFDAKARRTLLGAANLWIHACNAILQD